MLDVLMFENRLQIWLIYGYYIWLLYMVIIYIYIWLLYMVNIYGYYIWLLYMVIIYG